MNAIEKLINKWEQEADKFHEIVENPSINAFRLPALASEERLRECINELKNLPNEPKIISNNEQAKKDCTHSFIPGRVTVGTEVCIYCGFARMKQSD